jgi:5'-deoxynucleotidase YfbR-like HD superfamily hydrolase
MILIIVQAFEKPSVELLTAAVMHDIPEGVTGDIPAPVKWALREDKAFDFSILENQIFEFLHMKFPQLTNDELMMLKAADFIDAAFTCLLERANGNREVDWVFHNYACFEGKSRLLNGFRKLKDIWLDIKQSYDALQRQEIPVLLNDAEKVNFWEQNESHRD